MNTIRKSGTAVVIGRWQIPHKGHQTLYNEAFKYENVVIVVGSSFKSRSVKNPFNATERIDMISLLIPEHMRDNVKFLPVRDYGDDSRWLAAVKSGVAKLFPNTKPVLIGHSKDHTSYYLNNFESWKYEAVEKELELDATDLRKMLFESKNTEVALKLLGQFVSAPIIDYLQSWSLTPFFKVRQAEQLAVAKYKEEHPASIHYTGDALVTANNKVLLVKRDSDVGHGQWALPGGLVKEREKAVNTAIRELREETKLGIMEGVLKSNINAFATFDNPDRSPRGRIVSNVVHFDLGELNKLPEIHGAAKVKEAFWFPIADIPANEEMFFEDHSLIIDHFLKVF